MFANYMVLLVLWLTANQNTFLRLIKQYQLILYFPYCYRYTKVCPEFCAHLTNFLCDDPQT